MTSRSATLIGCGAIALWSLLALLTAGTGAIPPFQLVAMTLGLGGTLAVLIAVARGRAALLRPHPPALALGIAGLFGDTALYYSALKLAPPAEANLLHYLWPLLIVLFAILLPGGRLRAGHLVGAGFGLAAVLFIVGDRMGGGAAVPPGAQAIAGYACAVAGAVLWAGYSVLSRRVADVPTESVAVTLLVSAALALAAHLAAETTVWPGDAWTWVSAIGLGAGPMGLAFLLWDIGMKKGDVSFLGVASYAAPVLSTLTLVAAGYAQASWALAGACGLIVAGALVASAGARRSTAPSEAPHSLHAAVEPPAETR